ncbi:MAG: mshD [Rhodoglobus sp.]|nr:mshD [Rhodoglobus sp.]
MDAGLSDLIERARAFDGTPPFSDGALVELERGERQLVRLEDATALATDTSAEFVVDPDARRRGQGTRMLELLTSRSRGEEPREKLFWAHGNHPAARALARSHGLEPVRELLQLRAPVQEISESALASASTTVSAFRVGTDEDAWLELNARAFAQHPEQGAVTREDLETLMAEPWFHADDFLMLWEGNDLVGYSWLKIDGATGEFYVVGVHPDRQGAGLGRRLVEAGLARLAEEGIRESLLYVEAENAPALRLYRSFGFREHSIDVQYRWRLPQ